MKLKQVEITHFRCFESLQIELQPDVNVVVGVNAAGKSAMLDAISCALNSVLRAITADWIGKEQYQATALRPEDLHVDFDGEESTENYIRVFASIVDYYSVQNFKSINEKGESNAIEWSEDIFRKSDDWLFIQKPKRINKLSVYIDIFNRLIKNNKKEFIPCPVIAYYRSSRHISVMPELGDMTRLKLDRHMAYEHALDAGSNYQAIFQWFYIRENQELRARQRQLCPEFPDLRAVRAALRIMLEHVDQVYIDGNPPTLMVSFTADSQRQAPMSLAQLSDGYRHLLVLVLDFARRLALANPNSDNPLEAPGILLIDEIDLHLHPKWQQRVIPNLRRTFPNTQIIATTHSPQILTTIHPRNIIILKDQRVFTPTSSTFGAESSRTMREIMGAEDRPPDNENAQAIIDLFALIHRAEYEAAQTRCLELRQRIGADEPALIEADTIIKNRLWEKEVGL